MDFIYATPFLLVFLYYIAGTFFDVLIFSKIYTQNRTNPLIWQVYYQDLGSKYRSKNPFFSAFFNDCLVRGNPDLILKVRFLPIYKIIDYKTRQGTNFNLYEEVQLTLYQWLLRKNTLFCICNGYVLYSDFNAVPVPYSQTKANEFLQASDSIPLFKRKR